MTTTERGGYLANARNTDKIADIAAKAWDAGLVETINGIEADDYVNRVTAHAIKALFWADALAYQDSGDAEDADGWSNGDYDLPGHDTSDYDGDKLDASDRESIERDCEGFVRSAWPYLVVGGSKPEDVGRDFHLTRNGHGAGFWDGDYQYGDSLTELSRVYGDIGVMIAVDDDDEPLSFIITH